jgi:SNF2 family DNA or RNA helicase
VVTNYEFLRSEEHREKLMELLHGFKVMMVCDESSFIKNRTAAQTKACIKIGKTVSWRVIMNGTPVSEAPLDIWAQMQFLSAKILPYKNFFHFRSEFAVMGGWQNHKVVQWKNLDKLQALVAPYVIRREKKDCLDLPEKIYTQREIKLDEATWKIYKQMRDEAVVWLEENPSMAAQAGVRIMRLSQITSGFLGGFPVDDPGQEAKVEEIGREKLDWLRGFVTEQLEADPSLKIIVWCRFRPEIERVARDLADIIPTYRLYGQSKGERVESISRFSKVNNPEPALLAGQVRAGGFGLNLIAGAVSVYLSNDFSAMTRAQSEDRNHRPGQMRNVLYVDVMAVGPKGQRTVDHQVVKALREKNDLSNWTVSAWKRALTEEDQGAV